MVNHECCDNEGDLAPHSALDTQLLDLVQRPVEAATPVHVLSPCSHFLDVDGPFLVTIDFFPLRGTEPAETHHRHHGVVLTSIHCIFVGLTFLWCIWVKVRS